MQNLAYDKRKADHLREMRALMQHDLEAIGRPFGEFIPGHNTSPPGQINEQLALIKQIEINGKKITVPEALNGTATDTSRKNLNDKLKKRAERDVRKKAREAKKKIQEKSS